MFRQEIGDLGNFRWLYRVLWSADIIDELRRNLVEDGFEAGSIDRLIGEMGAAFPDAEATGYRSLIDGLTCDPKDRHVLAAAVRSDAAAIVTFNVDDFPEVSVVPFEIEVIPPDTFLLDQLDLAPGASSMSSADKQWPTGENQGRSRASSTHSPGPELLRSQTRFAGVLREPAARAATYFQVLLSLAMV
ncbi:MAG: PIN domain-containing protein [Actinobacteria bacterium]|nr:PIN domain-containing protein [Actinomycetota bacterium]